MERKRRRWRWILLIVFVLVVGAIVLHWPVPLPDLEVGPETTVLEGPLNPDGTVNYLQAIDAEAAEGVTNDNNAAVLLLRALGPRAIRSVRARSAVLKLFALESLPAEGEYFVTLGRWASARMPTTQQATPRPFPLGETLSLEAWRALAADGEKSPASRLREQMRNALNAPWDPNAHPELAKWLAENTAALDLVAAAGKRERYYLPLGADVDVPSLVCAKRPLNTFLEREALMALGVRAMMRIRTGNVQGACADTRALWRLGRVMRQRPTMTGCLMGALAEGIGRGAATTLATSGQLTSEQARAMLADIDALPSGGDIADVIDRHERFITLDVIALLTRGVPADAGESDPAKPRRKPNLDPNEMLRLANKWYDRSVACHRIPTEAARRVADAAFRADLQDAIEGAGSKVYIAKAILLRCGGWPCRKARSRFAATALLAMTMSTFSRNVTKEREAGVGSDLARVAVALAGHRAETGQYPGDLRDLSPGCLKEIPRDRFTGGDLVYERTAEGYLLYSVGPDGRDDGGLERENHSESYDIVVRVPPADRPSGSTP